ncbi:MAG: dethiobiotin synthase [Solirubrobacterales bacterium]
MRDAPGTSRGVFVTGTGTGVGKSVVAASIVAALTAKGHKVGAFKPVVTGLDQPSSEWPLDHELLAAATGWQTPEQVTPYTFGPAVSPHLAARVAGTRIAPATIDDAFERVAATSDVIVCEGVGGLLVPLSLEPPLSVLDLIKRSELPVVVVTHPGLGTISDTRLTVDRLHCEGVAVLAVVLSPWPRTPTSMQRSNRESVEKLCDAEVFTLPETTPDSLAAAGADLPVEDWAGLSPAAVPQSDPAAVPAATPAAAPASGAR